MNAPSGLRNHLRAVRTRLGLSQQELARAAGVTRQTVGGIEADLYAPSAAVAMRLANALGCRVEDLFWLEEDLPVIAARPSIVSTEAGERVALARISGHWVAHLLRGDDAFRDEMVPADGLTVGEITADGIRVRLLDDPESLARAVVIAGCSPALSLWARAAERWHPGLRVHWLHANSTRAVRALAAGHVHLAGLHLSGEHGADENAAAVRHSLGDRPATLVTLGIWEEGLVVSSSDLMRIQGLADLARPELRIVHREPGSGAQRLLESSLRSIGVAPREPTGEDEPPATSHQEVASRIASGLADVGVTTAAVAALYGLKFLPLRRARFDLALLAEHLEHEPVRQLLGTLHHPWVRRQLELLGGYDTAATGETREISGESDATA